MSAAAIARLPYDRRRVMTEYLDVLRSRGEDTQLVESAIAAWDEHGGDPIDENCRFAAQAVAAALAELGYDRAVLDRLEICSVARQAISAAGQAYGDGSALIRISDALFAFAHLYSSHLAYARVKESALASLRAVFRRNMRDESGLDEVLLTASLRFSALHQRVLGGAMTPVLALGESQQAEADRYLTHCLRFVVAHEYGHVLLGHSAVAAGVASCSGDPRWETEADELALRTVVHAQRGHGPGTALHAGFGALLAIVVVHFAERALYVHRGSTHPPAAERQERLVRSLPPHVALLVRQYGETLMALTDRAADFTLRARAVPWQPVLEHPRVVRHALWDDYRDDITRYAEIQSGAPDRLASALRALGTRHGTAVPAGAESMLSGRPRNGLRLWGLADPRIEEITDPALPLSFWALLEDIRESLPVVGSAPHEVMELALHAATLTQHVLMKETRR